MLAAASWATGVFAADKPAYGPPPSWVDVAKPPETPTPDGAPALQTLLDDNQSRLSPDGDVFYSRRVVKVLKTEGLSDLTSESFTWSPDTESMSINTIAIRRGGKVIDLLQGGDGMLVLRRETGLEAGMLDGRLTATRQIEGLQVGDVLDVAWTVAKRDPVTKGRSEDPEGLSSSDVIGRYRVRISWPSADPVRWRVTEGLSQPTVTTSDGRTVLLLDAVNVKAPVPPISAPARFRWLGRLYASSFRTWPDVSALVYPLFDRAATVKPSSALLAEADAIAARSTDPKVRAFQALRLVEDKVRYLYVGTNDGGYIPADADETWRRRFGDCKGKTVVLLTLLRRLGVEATPALVSTGAGDGLNEDLPGLGRFDHVIIRAVIGGKVYWLDGTREGDVASLDDQQPPSWRWALPLRSGGAALEPILQRPAERPMTDVQLRIDASKGLDAPAPAEIRMILHGDMAIGFRTMAARATREDLERDARHAFSSSLSWIEPKSVSWRDRPQEDAFELDLTGVADMDWRENEDLHVREFKVAGATTEARVFPRRESGAGADAPFVVAFPLYMSGSVEVELPDSGKGFSVKGANIDETVGEYRLVRTAKLDGDAARFTYSLKSLAPEVAASEAEAANKALRRLADDEDLIRQTPSASASKVTAEAKTAAMTRPGV